MAHPTRPTRWIRWVTLCAFVLATLVPGVARAWQQARGDAMPWSVVCSASGVKRVVVLDAADHGPAPGQPTHPFEHCAACALHLDGAAPPPAPSAAVAHPERSRAPPALRPPAPRPLHAWRGAQPRAPPLRA